MFFQGKKKSVKFLMRNMSFTEAACTQLLIQQEEWLPFPWVSAFVALCVSEGSEAVESSWT